MSNAQCTCCWVPVAPAADALFFAAAGTCGRDSKWAVAVSCSALSLVTSIVRQREPPIHLVAHVRQDFDRPSVAGGPQVSCLPSALTQKALSR